jgi:hypothetical protein
VLEIHADRRSGTWKGHGKSHNNKMNNKVMGRYLFSSFALMYARKLNGSKDYRKTKIVRVTLKKLMKRNRKMVK